MESEEIDSRRSTMKHIVVLNATFVLIDAAYTGVLNLQSSINIDEGIGTTSMLIIFVVSAISSLCFVPFLINYFGPKTALVLGEMSYIVYIAANFYPSRAILWISSGLHGIFESVPFTAMPIFVVYLAKEYWIVVAQEASQPSKVPPLATYTQRALGYFYAASYVAQIAGNAFSSAVFFIFDNKDSGTSNLISLHTTVNTTPLPDYTSEKYFDLKSCGANDCQVDYVFNRTEAGLSKYRPSPTGIYFLLTFFLATVITGVVIQEICLPSPPSKLDENRRQEATKRLSDSNRASSRSSIAQYFSDIARHLFSPLNLLMSTTFYYCGLVYGYNVSEYSRAYVSCVVGVEQVGIAMTLRGVGAGTASALFGTIQPRIGTKRFALLIGSIHLTTYVVSLQWQPAFDTIWVVYLLGVLVGIDEGFMFCLSDGLTAMYFKDRLGVAFSANSLLMTLGMATATGWSTILCVSTKLYIHISVLAVSMVTLVVCDWKYNKETRRAPASAEDSAESDMETEETHQLL